MERDAKFQGDPDSFPVFSQEIDEYFPCLFQ